MEKQHLYHGISVDDKTAKLLDDAFWAEETANERILRIFTPNLYSRLERKKQYGNYFLHTTSLSGTGNNLSMCHEFVFKKESFTLIGFSVFSCYFKNICCMNYEMVNEILDRSINASPIISKDILAALSLTYQLMNRFYYKKQIRAHKIFSNYTKLPREIDANGMIGLLMVFLNSSMANFAVKNLVPFVFLKQTPNKDVAKNLELKKKDLLLKAMNLKRISEEEMMDDEFKINNPKYCPKPTDNWGHLLPWYCHISSPSRRLADFINQTNLVCFLQKKKYLYSFNDIDKLSVICNEGKDDNFFQENLVKKEVNRIITLNRSYALLNLLRESRGKCISLYPINGKSYTKLLTRSAKKSQLLEPVYLFDFDKETMQFKCEAFIGISGKIESQIAEGPSKEEAKQIAAKALYEKINCS